jgi:hypothetical protein
VVAYMVLARARCVEYYGDAWHYRVPPLVPKTAGELAPVVFSDPS